MKIVVKFLSAVFSTLLLSSCSGTYQSYYDTLKLALTAQPDAQLTLQQVAETKHDLLYVKSGERPQAVMALAYREQGQQKWISADNAMLVLENGRIARTLGFEQDLLHTTNLSGDPLKRLLNDMESLQWLRLTDWRQGEYGYRLQSTFKNEGIKTLTIFDQTLQTTLVTEQVELLDDTQFLRLNNRWQNFYWFEHNTGQLIKSVQLPAPFWQPLEITYISRISRLLTLPQS